jgi:hypothetical protein
MPTPRDIEDALRAWVKTASGLDDAHVIWGWQGGPRPSGTHIDLRIGPRVPVGLDSHDWNYDAARPPGQEIEHRVTGLRELTLSVQCYSSEVSGNASAPAILAAVQTRMRLPSIHDALSSAGLSCFDNGQVMHVPQLVDADWESRAVLETRWYYRELETEMGGYIASVEITNQMTGETFEVEAP